MFRMAALFRLAAREGLHEGISNHFSYAVSEDGQQFLMNPFGIHFSQIKASDLLLFDTASPPDVTDSRVDITAWSIHGAMHQANPAARYACICTLIMPPLWSVLNILICRRSIRPRRDSIIVWPGIRGLMVWG